MVVIDWLIDLLFGCCLMRSVQFFSNITALTSCILMRWWVHRKNSSRVNMFPHSEILSWFWAKQRHTESYSLNYRILPLLLFPRIQGVGVITWFVTRVPRRLLLMGQELLTLPEHMSSSRGLSGIHVARSLIFCILFVDHCLSLLIWPLYCLSLFIWPLYGLSLFDLWLLNAPLVSSNFSYEFLVIMFYVTVYIHKQYVSFVKIIPCIILFAKSVCVWLFDRIRTLNYQCVMVQTYISIAKAVKKFPNFIYLLCEIKILSACLRHFRNLDRRRTQFKTVVGFFSQMIVIKSSSISKC